MTKSKMMEVAKILGVDIGQQFKIKGYVSKYELQNDGLHFCGNKETVRGYILERLLTGKEEIEKPILDKVEKRYLENVLRPFKDRVLYIRKLSCSNQRQYLLISLNLYEILELPYFKENTMYKGIEVDKRYTLKELGLFERC